MGESHVTADGSIHYGREGTLVISVSAASEWSDTAWKEFLDGSIAMEPRMGGPALLVFSYIPHGIPTAGQRRLSVVATQKSRLADRVAMLSDSVLTRGGFTAIQWMLGKQTNHRAFRPVEVRPALNWLAEAHTFDVLAAKARIDAMIRTAYSALGRPPPR
jgi:hypothetical protein